MQPSKLIKKPAKFKGTPEMRELAEGECWEDFVGIVDDMHTMTALELATFHAEWYLKVGHVNLGRFYVAALKANAQTNIEPA